MSDNKINTVPLLTQIGAMIGVGNTSDSNGNSITGTTLSCKGSDHDLSVIDAHHLYTDLGAATSISEIGISERLQGAIAGEFDLGNLESPMQTACNEIAKGDSKQR